MSTYSTNLRLELPVAGTQVGSWGTTTNTNLGSLVEQAISGVQTITIGSGATYTLVSSNGATDEARNAVLVLSTASQNFTLYAPPVAKLYTIYNATSYTATIYNTGYSSGVTIPAGLYATVYTTGTAFSFQSNMAVTQTAGDSTQKIATTAFVQSTLSTYIYPVGSIYIATVATNPATLLGFGTWVAYGAGRFLLSVGTLAPNTYAGGATGGSPDAVVVTHTHASTAAFTGSSTTTSNTDLTHSHSFTGTAHTHNYWTNGGNGPDGNLSSAFTYRYGSGSSYWSSSSGFGLDSTVAGGTVGNSLGNHTHTNTATGTVAMTNPVPTGSPTSGTNDRMPPYIAVYMWNRTV